MKRFSIACGILSLCFVLAGCESNSREGLIDDTVGMMNTAAGNIGNIKKSVDDAVSNYKSGKTQKLDLSEAIKATDKLKETGAKTTIEIKARIDIAKAQQISDQERSTYAENKQEALNAAFKLLLTKQDDLRKAMDAARKCGAPNAAQAVDELHRKYVEAESPFEAIAR
ncbi:MAG TPA: hypothetical protein VFE62_15890 [Gemmataceae bacterium]|nr:hypothetical protein [Gemmataceae bacterium]